MTSGQFWPPLTKAKIGKWTAWQRCCGLDTLIEALDMADCRWRGYEALTEKLKGMKSNG